MDVLVVIATLALLAGVIVLVGAPLRSRRRIAPRPGAPAAPAAGAGELQREELEAAREAKYREIRDAELDYRTGKLSREDYEAIDSTLRAEAIEILRRLDSTSV